MYKGAIEKSDKWLGRIEVSHSGSLAKKSFCHDSLDDFRLGFLLIWIVRIQEFDVGERKVADFAPEFAFPLSINIHFCYFDSVSHLQGETEHKNTKKTWYIFILDIRD